MTEDVIGKFFGDSDDFDEYYPGSKRKRRSVSPVDIPGKDDSDVRFVTKTLSNGNTIEFASAGALAAALGRPLVTVRLWERKGYIPRAPYRLRSVVIDGVKKPGWRMYSRAMLNSIVESFRSRGLLESPRIDWNKHRDLSVEILENWSRIHNEETKTG